MKLDKKVKWMMHDWMKAVKSPIRYRVNNKFKFKINLRFILMSLSTFLCLCFLYYLLTYNGNKESTLHNSDDLIKSIDRNVYYKLFNDHKDKAYNRTYPLSAPVRNHKERTWTYDIMAIADLDTNSKLENSPKFVSYLLGGKLTVSEDLKSALIHFESEPVQLNSEYSYGERGMELSELVIFNGKLYSCDDRTGIIYEIKINEKMAIPWVLLTDGDGNTMKGFKCEWMTVKEQKLFVGGLGKEWTTSKGVLVNHNPQWIKVVGHVGDVSHLDWKENYNKIRALGNYNYPGYMIFESAAWSEMEKKWYFLPRRASQESYDETLDEKRATNLMISASENFEDIAYKPIGNIIPVRGYSSFKFVPNTNEHLILALKSEEDSGKTRTYVTVFDKNGFILVNDQLISDQLKYEGIEFI